MMKDWFKNIKIRQKMAFSALVVILIFLLFFGPGFNYLLNTSQVVGIILKGQSYHNVQFLSGTQEFYKYLVYKNNEDLKAAYGSFERANKVAQVFGNINDLSDRNSQEEFTRILYHNFSGFLESMTEAKLLSNRIRMLLWIGSDELKLSQEKAAQAFQIGIEMKQSVEQYIVNSDNAHLEIIQNKIDEMLIVESGFAHAIKRIDDYISGVLFILTMALFLILAFVFLIFLQVMQVILVNPMSKIIKTIEKIIEGDLSVKVEVYSKDEFGQLALAIEDFQENILRKVEHAKLVAAGSYKDQLEPTSEKDELTIALNEMTDSLLEKDIKTKEQDWLKTGQNDLSEINRRDQDIVELCQNTLNYIAKYVNAQIGAIYIKNETDEYSMIGSYAFSQNKDRSNIFKMGEGLVGQCALEKKSIIIKNVPDDCIKINSGIVERVPSSILLTPLLMDKNVVGVIELGTLQEFNDLQLQFLDQISEMLAIAFQTADSRIKMRELLQKTQHQAEEMDKQREELRVTNEELKTQQEELQQTNEELEEKTESLEGYTEEIRQKNQDLHSAQLLLEEHAKELEVASKYKSEFLANMSHELRTPLNSLLILSKMLADNKEGNLTEKQVKFASTVHSAGAELLELINDILDLSKVESGKMILNYEDFELKNVANYIQQNYEHIAKEKGLYLKTRVSNDLPPIIHSDRQKVEQILKNLISNSLKFTENGGIAIDIHQPSNNIKLLRGSLNNDQVVCISVSDTGIGIPAEKQKLIFEAFQQADGTTNRKFGGTGLGLSISKEFSYLLGGEIQLESMEGKGSTFSLYLPYSKSTEQKQSHLDTEQEKLKITKSISDGTKDKAQIPPISSVAFDQSSESIRDDRLDIYTGNKTILIIENDAKFAKILFDFARNKGFKCLIAVDGEAGLQLAFQYKPSVIISEIELPRMDGLIVMERLKKNSNTRHIPVHFISISDKSQKALNMGAIGYLRKPVDMEGLNLAFHKIEDALDKLIKKLLLVVKDENERNNILNLMAAEDVETTAIDSGKKALKLLQTEKFDCMVIDLSIKDIPVLNIVKQVREDNNIPNTPVIIYTENNVSRKEETELSKYTESIIHKNEKYMDRLHNETTLFLHHAENGLPQEQLNVIKIKNDQDMIFNDKKILIVDDDMRNVFALSNILEEKGMKIIAGKNGVEALEKLKKNDHINLVLMDIMMPEMDGYEAMKRIRKQKKFSNLPIIALTAKAMKGDRSKCINAGATDYMSKPVDPEKLLSLLQVWLYK